jgi:D-3-phosphoglycerate dehydrogenase / 2-oxoglutarate reductase
MAKPRVKKCEVLVINQIAQVGLKRLPSEKYSILKEAKDPAAILVRSADLHKFEFGPSLKAVGRAGAGVNNIPVPALSKRGVPVFNAPGANANAVKELVLAGMLIAARNLGPAFEFIKKMDAKNFSDKAIEEGKKQFAGVELPGHTLGLIGLGKIGSLVADAAIRLGMNVVGYDPQITVEAAWSLPSQVRRRYGARTRSRRFSRRATSSACTSRSTTRRGTWSMPGTSSFSALAPCCSTSLAKAWWRRRRWRRASPATGSSGT